MLWLRAISHSNYNINSPKHNDSALKQVQHNHEKLIQVMIQEASGGTL